LKETSTSPKEETMPAYNISGDVYNPNYTQNPAMMTYLKQSRATSGTAPSASTLDQIVQGELDAAYRNQMANKQLQTNRQQFAAGQALTREQMENQMMGGIGNTLGVLGSAYLTGPKSPLTNPATPPQVTPQPTGVVSPEVGGVSNLQNPGGVEQFNTLPELTKDISATGLNDVEGVSQQVPDRFLNSDFADWFI
jgi:hypothetical protein